MRVLTLYVFLICFSFLSHAKEANAGNIAELQKQVEEAKQLNINGEYEQSISLLTSVLEKSKALKEDETEGDILLELGKSYQLNMQHATALRYIQSAKFIFQKLKNKDKHIRSVVYLMEYYRSISKLDLATKYKNEAFKLAKNVKLSALTEILLYNRAAAIESETLHPKLSFEHSTHAIALSEKNKLPYLSAVSENEIGFYYENTLDFKKAIYYYRLAQRNWKLTNAIRDYVNVTENIARVYRKMGNYKESNSIAFEAMKLAEKNNWWTNLQSIYLLIEGNYYLLDNKEKSYFFKARSLQAQIATYKKENARELKELIQKYETEKKDREIERQKAVLKLVNKNYENERKYSIALFWSFLFLLMLLLWILYLFQNRNKLLKVLKNKKIEQEQINIQLSEALAESEVLLQEVHHRVKNNLQIISSLIEMEMMSNKEQSKSDSLEDINRRVNAMSLVHQLLYNEKQIGSIKARDYFEKMVKGIDKMVKTEMVSIEIKLSVDDVDLDVNKGIYLGMILSELISNSYKHAFKIIEEPKIFIDLHLDEKKWIHFLYRDNGIGIQNIKTVSMNMGWRLIQIFSVQLKGKHTFETKESFTFELSFPIEK